MAKSLKTREARATVEEPLSAEELRKIDAYLARVQLPRRWA